MTQGARHLVAGFAILLVIAGIGGGLMILGPPSEERIRRLDQKRVSDLQGIQSSVNIFRMRHERLPMSLDEITPEDGLAINRFDPETQKAYEYRTLDDKKFEVCAVFARKSTTELRYPGQAIWAHGAGRRCFQPPDPESSGQGLNFVK